MWENMKFSVQRYFKGTQERGSILGSVDEIMQNLDDNAMNLQSMAGSRFVGPFLSTIQQWEKNLSLIGEVIEVRTHRIFCLLQLYIEFYNLIIKSTVFLTLHFTVYMVHIFLIIICFILFILLYFSGYIYLLNYECQFLNRILSEFKFYYSIFSRFYFRL